MNVNELITKIAKLDTDLSNLQKAFIEVYAVLLSLKDESNDPPITHDRSKWENAMSALNILENTK